VIRDQSDAHQRKYDQKADQANARYCDIIQVAPRVVVLYVGVYYFRPRNQ